MYAKTALRVPLSYTPCTSKLRPMYAVATLTPDVAALNCQHDNVIVLSSCSFSLHLRAMSSREWFCIFAFRARNYAVSRSWNRYFINSGNITNDTTRVLCWLGSIAGVTLRLKDTPIDRQHRKAASQVGKREGRGKANLVGTMQSHATVKC